MTDTFDGGGGELTPGNPAGFIAYQVSIGASARESLAEWRSLGGTSGNQAWNALYGQVTDAMLRRPDWATLDPNTLPTGADYGTWAMGSGGEYATQVKVMVTDADTGDELLLDFTHTSSDPHTPAEAMAAALADYGDADTLDQYAQTLQGAFVSAVYRTVPWNE